MASTINTNIQSLTAQRNLANSQLSLSTSMQRLSSGLRINSAKDDAAGLAISERMTAQIRGLDQAARNANDGISLSQVAEGALGTTASILQRIRELAVQSVNATNSAGDRAALQKEVAQLTAEVDRIATQSQFNGTNLLDGSFTAQDFQVGANSGQTIQVSAIQSSRATVLGKYNGLILPAASIGTASDTSVASQTITIGTGAAIELGPIQNDAKALAAAITSKNISGMTVKANAATVTTAYGPPTGATPGNVNFTLNGQTVTVAGTSSQATNVANTLTAINNISNLTGITAIDTGTGVKLTAADGRNITVSAITNVTPAVGFNLGMFGLAAGTTGGTLNIDYAAPDGVTGTVTAGPPTAPWVLNSGNVITAVGTSVSDLDISTAAGAVAAIHSIDAALTTVNTNRATLGAVQSRFENAISAVNTTSNNLSASRSRILDADFAQETANLSRTQILQQAGTAMVAQANQLPQSVLQLLKG